MSPPGKKSGVTTYESVVNATRAPSTRRTAWSSCLSRYGLAKAGRKHRAIRSADILPPLPWPSSTRSASVNGTGHARARPARRASAESASDDILGPERHVHQVPHDVVQRDVRLLDPVDAERGHDEAAVREVGESPAVLAREGDREQPELAGRLDRADQVRRVAARAEQEGHVAVPRQHAELVGEDGGKVAVVRDRGDQGLVGGERERRQRPPLLDDRVEELDRDVLR